MLPEVNTAVQTSAGARPASRVPLPRKPFSAKQIQVNGRRMRFRLLLALALPL